MCGVNKVYGCLHSLISSFYIQSKSLRLVSCLSKLPLRSRLRVLLTYSTRKSVWLEASFCSADQIVTYVVEVRLHVDERQCLLKENNEHARGDSVLIESVFDHVRLLRENKRRMFKP